MTGQSEYNEYHRQYQKRRRLERLAMAKERLGGQCARCGSTEDLQFDHVVPGSRARKISEATNWSLERFLAEVDKCQLLCDLCHRGKTTECGEWAHGEGCARAKLNVDAVRAIRASSATHRYLANEYGISKTAIYKVRRRLTWKHVD